MAAERDGSGDARAEEPGAEGSGGQGQGTSPRIRTGRIGRTAGVGGMVAKQGIGWAGTRIANVGRNEERRQEKTDERVGKIAVQIARQLGEMKGAAMKIGQVLATVELPGLSEEGQEEFRAALAQLRDNAPKFGYEDIRKVIETDLGGKVEDHFAEFDREAFAAASIGQVHRAKTHDGDCVAVKVQYPGIAEAVDIDLRNLHLILRLVKRMAPGLDVKAVGGEIRERISEELDYELEAQNHRAMERAYRGHPFAVVPRVFTGVSSRRVLVTEYLEGKRFEEVKKLGDDERDRYGEIVFRFFFDRGRTLMILGDPHPGNYLLLEDGRVGFLDFGMVRRVSHEHFDRERRLGEAIAKGDAQCVHDLMSELGYLPDPAEFDPDALLDQVRGGTEWLFVRGFRRLDPDYAHEMIEMTSSPRSPHYDAMKRQTLPAASLLMRRQEGLVFITLADLRAGADWARIMAEYLSDEPPSTEIGEAEKAWSDSIS
jgi:predicted unusual protein kinase regulating ubiquinone biosynthesis (AarF/ABC1/UbiB family)